MFRERTTLGLAAILLMSSWAGAQEIYVDSVAGADTNDGASETTPKKTLPSGTGARYDTLYLKAGGTYETTGLRVSNAAVVSYGEGSAPVVLVTGGGFGMVSVTGNALLDGIKVKGASLEAEGTGITVSGSGNEVMNCEVDGSGSSMMMGFGIMGTGNYIHHNNVHDLGLSVSGDQMGTSGGAEAYMVMGSDNEIAYNVASRCYSSNSTLGGAEGGCLEIVNGEGGSTISGVSFHHNYCEFSVGLWEGCSGNFTGGDAIQLNHGIIRDSYIAYNVAIDAMWLYLIQPVNTDFINVVFEHNTLIHTAANDDIPQGAANAFTLAVEQETVQGVSYGPTPVQPGNITVRNNIFLVDGGSGMFNGTMPAGDNYNNLYAGVAFPRNWTQGEGEIVVSAEEAGIGLDGRPAAGSVVIDAGSALAVREDWVDFDGNAVPQGAAPDIGAFEYCEGDSCQQPATGGTSGTGGAVTSGGTGASATGGGGSGGAAMGGEPATGGSSSACSAPLTPCGSACVNLATDSSHCGDCKEACTAGLVCSAGTCTSTCDPGLAQCEQSCVDFATDQHHCSACGIACLVGQVCSNGVCSSASPEGESSDDDDDGGCGCGTAQPDTRAAATLAGLLLGLSVLRLRRRQGAR